MTQLRWVFKSKPWRLYCLYIGNYQLAHIIDCGARPDGSLLFQAKRSWSDEIGEFSTLEDAKRAVYRAFEIEEFV